MGKKKTEKETKEEEIIQDDQTIDQEGQVDEKESQDQEVDLNIQLAEAKDKYLRLFAEFDNYKKRTMKEKLDLMRSAAQETMTAMLPIMDDFDRAKKAADEGAESEQFSEGVALVYQKFNSTLSNRGLKSMESNGELFDPEMHEAITEIPAPSDDMKGKVIDTVEKGYILNDKIIRYAKVVVGK
jgi:molecular chaperone GrpE